MKITQIELVDKKRKRIYIDDEFAYVLYNSEVRRFRLEEGEEIGQPLHDEIEQAVIKRAKLKVMDLLKRSDKTEQELRTKLRTASFPEKAVEEAISYVRGYKYLDDERYASNYIRMKKQTKSKNAIVYDLISKGIEKEIIDQYMEEEFDSDDEEEAIKKLIYKKTSNPSELDLEKKQKLVASICRKGFSYEKVKRIISNI